MEKQGQNRWNATLHARPFAERLADYNGDTIANAFPLQFPYGHTGLTEDKAVVMMRTLPENEKYMNRNRLTVMRKYLQHCNSHFHSPQFNLIVQNLIMKEAIFQSTRMYCSVKHADGSLMAEKYGAMSSDQLQQAIKAARQDHGSQYSTRAQNRYLRSIVAACEYLPHSNEAARDARRKYFSCLIKFGIPAIFLTITPDDKRNYRIVLYACKGRVSNFSSDYVNLLTDDEILAEFKFREKIREDHPGLCAEEYQRIIKLVIKHLFAWDEENQCSTGKGIFGELLAWCLATEEQGRKTLHGHFLLFIKNWEKVLAKMQKPGTDGYNEAKVSIKAFSESICSAQLFSDFGPNNVLKEQPVFYHENCRPNRAKKHRRFTPKYVGDQAIRDMRHKVKCNEEPVGCIATCEVCGKNLTVQYIIENALKYHLGCHPKGIHNFNFPKLNNRRLDMHVYEMQKDFDWTTSTIEQQAKRYFASNALTNFHLPTHTNRCFKKSPECFANLPDQSFPDTTIKFHPEIPAWTDWMGNKSYKAIFRIYPKRNLEDAFMNTHSEIVTKLLGTNNNVSAGLNGSSVFYCTGYNTKSQQKEEREAFENISRVIVRILEQQEKENSLKELTPIQLGFRRMLAGIYTHTNSHILAAPMAHYLAINKSRFHFSHSNEKLPAHGLEDLLQNKDMVMSFRKQDNKQIPYHKAMDYIYRPTEFEEMTPITFYSETERISSKGNQEESFAFIDGYPLQKTFRCKRRSRPVVPVFPWNWLPNTKSLKRSITDHPSSSLEHDFNSRELHARRFMILFSSFRKKEDLISQGSHQSMLCEKLKEKCITTEMIKIADNIQNIYNSLEAGQCENFLSSRTDPPDADDIEEKDDGGLQNFDEFLARIGDYLASTSDKEEYSSEATDLTPEFIHPKNPNQPISESNEVITPLQDVFGTETTTTSQSTTNKNCTPSRFVTKTSQLNSLFTSTFCRHNPEYETYKNSSKTEKNEDKKPPKYIVTPNGTWQSIVAWGKNAELDTEQEICFQIIASTYVLSFLNEAEDDCLPHEKKSFIENQKKLSILARQKNRNDPIRLFITGPAGAGKCK